MQPTVPKVSVIIPVYKAQPYIEKCAKSLFSQTLDSIEYIFIDDCSPDDSVEIIEKTANEFPNREKQIKIIRHSKNQGVGKSRQDGLDIASGEYIIHCDPDDWVEYNMYEKMYDAAKNNNADIVSSNFIIEYPNGKYCDYNESYSTKESLLHSLISNNWATLWRILIISTIAKAVRFIPGVDAGEDYAYICTATSMAYNIYCLQDKLYHYNRANPSSIISTKNLEKSNQQAIATIEVEKILGEKFPAAIINRKMKIKNEMLKFGIEKWRETFPEINYQCLMSAKAPINHRIINLLLWNLPSPIITQLIKFKYR